MNYRNAALAVAGAGIAVLFAWVSVAGGVNLWVEPQLDLLGEAEPSEPDSECADTEQDGLGEAAPTEPETECPEPETETEVQPVGTSDPIDLPDWIVGTLRVLAVVAGFIAAIALARFAWHHRPRLRWRRRDQASGDFVALPDVAAVVADRAAAQRAALLGGTARNAIVQCWLQLERDVEAAGLPRNAADTSMEFTERVLADYAVDSSAIRTLAHLYRRARFSEHRIGEAERQRAVEALDQLHQALGAVADEAGV